MGLGECRSGTGVRRVGLVPFSIAAATAKYYAKRVRMKNVPRNVLHTLQQHLKNLLNKSKQTKGSATNKLQTINN